MSNAPLVNEKQDFFNATCRAAAHTNVLVLLLQFEQFVL
jgi:hypothetical protein